LDRREERKRRSAGRSQAYQIDRRGDAGWIAT
jgi:hypothetical protein